MKSRTNREVKVGDQVVCVDGDVGRIKKADENPDSMVELMFFNNEGEINTVRALSTVLVHADECYTIVRRMSGEKMDIPTGLEDMVERIASQMYNVYCHAVGGKSIRGEDLPDWSVFAPSNEKQANGWRAAAKAAMVIICGKN